MSVRLTGMASGLDTESIIEEMVSAYSTKLEKYEKNKTTLEWTEEAWKSVNTDVYSFFTSQLGTMRYQSAYTMQSTTISDSTKASVSASGSAVNGTQTINIYQLAKSGYLTGARLTKATSSSTTLAELSESYADNTVASDDVGGISVKVGDNTYSFTLDGSSSISDMVKAFNDNVTGITASYDSTNQRIFISSTSSGADNDFTIVGTNAAGTNMLIAAGINVSTDATKEYYSQWTSLIGDTDADTQTNVESLIANIQSALKAVDDANTAYLDLETEGNKWSAVSTYITDISSMSETKESLGMDDDAFSSLRQQLTNLSKIEDTSSDEYTELYDSIKTTIKSALEAKGATDTDTDTDSDSTTNYDTKAEETLSDLFTKITYVNEFEASEEYMAAYESVKSEDDPSAVVTSKIDTIKSQMSAAQENIDKATSAANEYSTYTGYLTGDYSITADTTDTSVAVERLIELAKTFSESAGGVSNGTKVDGSDLGMVLNGAVFTSSSNSITVNGLTINATGVTDSLTADQMASEQSIVDAVKNSSSTVSVTTNNDVDGVYSKIKSFFSSYNTLINSLNKQYNADSASGYEPLTDDEKDEMSDTEIEKWETKIKDALLRRDSTLNTIISAFTTAMSQSYYVKDGTAVVYDSTEGAYYYGYDDDGSKNYLEYNGNKITSQTELKAYMQTTDGKQYSQYSLSSFGIATLGYINAAENEQYAYHIDGDSEDSSTSSNTDKLRSALTSNSKDTTAFFSALISNAYNTINNKMKASSISSAYTIWNDKSLATEQEEVEDQIDKWEEKLDDLKDKWYSKFSAMETALAKLQSQTSSLSSLLGS